jgi:hypothetical protein
MKITKQVVLCLIIGIIFVIFGTSTERYYFEAFAVVMFVLAYVLADYDNLFQKKETKSECEVKK